MLPIAERKPQVECPSHSESAALPEHRLMLAVLEEALLLTTA